MEYIYKVLLIILLVSPIRAYESLTADYYESPIVPINLISPLLTIISSVGLAVAFKVNVFNQFIIAATILPNFIVNMSGLFVPPGVVRLFGVVVQVIIQGLVAVLLMNTHIKTLVIIIIVLQLFLVAYLLYNISGEFMSNTETIPGGRGGLASHKQKQSLYNVSA